MKNIVNFDEAKGLEIELVGGKGLNLAIMVSNEINVPPGFILLSSVYEEFIVENKIDCYIKKQIALIDDNNIEEILNDIKNVIINASFSREMELKIEEIFQSFDKPVHLAVRSSATAEDLEDASFAGQQETFLNVTSYQNLIYSIKCCFASLWGRRAYEYRKIKNYNQIDVSIAVIIQKMVNSDISGVMFTANPVSGKEEIVIEASYGLGEAIVSGQVSPDNCILNMSGELQSYNLGAKDIKMIYSGEGIKKVDTSQSEREERCIKNLEIKELWKQSVKIKNLYGANMDIEWAKEKETIYILQARKITTIDSMPKQSNIEINKFGKKEKKYLNNMIEHFPILWYPLDDDIAMILQNMKYDLLNEVGIYINNPLKMNDFGTIEVEKIKIKLGINILKYPYIYRKYKKHKSNIQYSINELDMIESKIYDLEKEIRSYNKNTKIEILRETINELIKIHKNISYIRFRYILFPSVILGGKLDKILKKLNKQYTEYDLLSNLEYTTILMNKDLNEIINKFKLNPKLFDLIEKGITVDDIKMNYKEEYKLLKKFIDTYGWKSNYCCIPFSSESWNENPKRFLDLLFLNSHHLEDVQTKISKYDIIIEDIKRYYKTNSNQKLLEEIENYRKYHVLRESSQYLWETVFGLLRLTVKTISLKVNIKYEDLLYLRIDELQDLMRENQLEKYINKISIRKSKRNEAENKWDNMVMSIFSDGNHDRFVGISGSNGKVKGRVCIIRDHSEFKKLKKDDILVCPYTDPEWTPLFKLAKGVVADTGGALSHAAIVAREYGIPAVLGVGSATIHLKDGDFIIVNGEQGVVEKII